MMKALNMDSTEDQDSGYLELESDITLPQNSSHQQMSHVLNACPPPAYDDQYLTMPGLGSSSGSVNYISSGHGSLISPYTTISSTRASSHQYMTITRRQGPDSTVSKARCNRTIVCLSAWLGVMAAGVIILTCLMLLWPGIEIEQASDITCSMDTNPTSTTHPYQPGNRCVSQCHPKYSCDKPRDPTTCDQCLVAQVQAGVHQLCVESCESVNSYPLSMDTNGIIICQDMKLVNIALPDPFFTSCHAASVHQNDHDTWGCQNVMDGGEGQWSPQADGPGPWIQFDFTQEYIVTGIEINGRSSYSSQCSEYHVYFSDYTIYQIIWECIEERPLVDYYFQPIRTKSVRIMCKVDCGPGGTAGFREIKIWALFP